MQKKGKFITVEGIEGAGKTTQVDFIANYIKKLGKKVLVTREPGGTIFGDKIRQILLDKETGNISADSELLLMFAARIEHINKKIKPALNKGIWVISDRFIDSSYAYQGGGRGIDFDKIKTLENWSIQQFTADLSLFLQIDLARSFQRIKERQQIDRFESEAEDFFIRVYKAFDIRAKSDRRRIKIIDANKDIINTQKQIAVELNKL